MTALPTDKWVNRRKDQCDVQRRIDEWIETQRPKEKDRYEENGVTVRVFEGR